jgi:hypothetical protein
VPCSRRTQENDGEKADKGEENFAHAAQEQEGEDKEVPCSCRNIGKRWREWKKRKSISLTQHRNKRRKTLLMQKHKKKMERKQEEHFAHAAQEQEEEDKEVPCSCPATG